MSRCPNPRDCECVFEKGYSALKCGPCPKCLRRSDVMQSGWNVVNIPLQLAGAATSIDFLDDTPDLEFPYVPRQEKVISVCEDRPIAWQWSHIWKFLLGMLWVFSVLFLGLRSEGWGSLLYIVFSTVVILLHRFVELVKVNKDVNFVRSVAPNVWFQSYTHNELEDFQGKDSVLPVVIQRLKAGKIPSVRDVVRSYIITGSTGTL